VEGELVAGRYRVQRRIASGGMGVVYEATHLETGRRVALKLMHQGAFFDSDSASWTARMRREARVAGALDTPHVVQVLDAGDLEDGQSYIAMELLKGSDLRQRLQVTGPLPPDVAARVVGQACLGVAAAHAAGVLHRDLKPGNLFLSVDELGGVTVKVLDFGIAKITSDPGLTRITATGQLIGTPTYVSPEQARGLSDVDARADVWSLGVVLFRLLCGAPPHELSGSLTDYLVTLCTVPAASVRSRAPWVPEELASIVSRALEIDRERRFPSVRAMFDALAALAPDMRLTLRELAPVPEAVRIASITPPPAVSPLPEPIRAAPRRNPALLVAVALVLTLALGLSAGFAFGRRDTSSPSPSPVATTAAIPRAEPTPSVIPGPPPATPSLTEPPASAAPPASSSPQVAPPADGAVAPKTTRKPDKPAPAPSQKPKLEFETGFE